MLSGIDEMIVDGRLLGAGSVKNLGVSFVGA